MEKYQILGKKGEGTFSEVLKCQNLHDGTFWAMKKMKQTYRSLEEIQQIREIRVLQQLNGHPNIIFLREIIFEKRSGTLCLIFELMSMNLYEYIRGRKRALPEEIVSKFMYQLLKALEYLHRHGYFHRDIKPENILIKDETLKLADFGSCRQTTSKPPLTEYISTRWYRAPECLLTDGFYRNEMDLWSAGCVMYEIISLRPLFPGSNEIDQIDRIHQVLGTPSSATLAKFRHRNSAIDFNFPHRRGTGIARNLTNGSSDTIDLIEKLCVYDPEHRWSAAQALRHRYFDVIRLDEQQGTRTAKQKENSMRSNSTSSESSQEEVLPSNRSNPQKSSLVHYQVLKPDFSQFLYPHGKAQSLIETRAHENSPRKARNQHKPTAKYQRTTNFYSHASPSKNFYSSLSATGPNPIEETRKNGKHFLPRISGASAFSNYSLASDYNGPIEEKQHFPTKTVVSYNPVRSFRSYRK